MIGAAQARTPPPREIRLAPGDFHFGGGRTRVRTLLGSCVAITLWHPARRIGGMCHYVLPGLHHDRLPRGHYAGGVMTLFMDAVEHHRTKPEDYQVKIFGGGEMFECVGESPAAPNVSRRNVAAGVRLLTEAGFAIGASDLGGQFHRTVCLDLWIGDVWVRRGAPALLAKG